MFSFSGAVWGSPSGCDDGSGASDRSDRRSEILPSGSFPFLSSSFSSSVRLIVSWNLTPSRRVSSSVTGGFLALPWSRHFWHGVWY